MISKRLLSIWMLTMVICLLCYTISGIINSPATGGRPLYISWGALLPFVFVGLIFISVPPLIFALIINKLMVNKNKSPRMVITKNILLIAVGFGYPAFIYMNRTYFDVLAAITFGYGISLVISILIVNYQKLKNKRILKIWALTLFLSIFFNTIYTVSLSPWIKDEGIHSVLFYTLLYSSIISLPLLLSALAVIKFISNQNTLKNTLLAFIGFGCPSFIFFYDVSQDSILTYGIYAVSLLVSIIFFNFLFR